MRVTLTPIITTGPNKCSIPVKISIRRVLVLPVKCPRAPLSGIRSWTPLARVSVYRRNFRFRILTMVPAVPLPVMTSKVIWVSWSTPWTNAVTTPPSIRLVIRGNTLTVRITGLTKNAPTRPMMAWVCNWVSRPLSVLPVQTAVAWLPRTVPVTTDPSVWWWPLPIHTKMDPWVLGLNTTPTATLGTLIPSTKWPSVASFVLLILPR